MNPKHHHSRLSAFNTIRKDVRKRRINNEKRRHDMAQAQYIAFPRLVVSPTERLVALTVDHNHHGK